MDPAVFKIADARMDEIAEHLDSALQSDQFAKVRQMLRDLTLKLRPRYAAELSVVVMIADQVRESSVPLLQTGFSTTDEGALYRTWDDQSAQRYVVDGHIQVVPANHCPKCWGDWASKFDNRTCETCGLKLGKDCMILLDSDLCPNCEKGSVSMAAPDCDNCGYKIDTSVVAWG